MLSEKEKFDIFISKGYNYDYTIGQIVGPTGKVCKKNNTGYIHLSTTHNMNRLNILSHRLIWYIIYNDVPCVIDHINGIKDDNNIENLRNITQQKNCFNKKSNGYSKVKDKFRVNIMTSGKNRFIGYFKTVEDAREAYLKAKEIYHVI